MKSPRTPLCILTGLTSLGLWLTPQSRAGDLNVVGNLNVTSNLTANTMAVNTVTLSGQARTNWSGGATVLTSAVLDFSQPGQYFSYTLTGGTTWVFTNHVAGQQVWLQVAQDSNGGHNNTWPAGLLWSGGTPVNGSTAPNTFSVYQIVDNGTFWVVESASVNYSVPCVTNCNFALQFDGSQNYVAVNSFGGLTTAFTFEAWYKPLAASSSYGMLFSYLGESLALYHNNGMLVWQAGGGTYVTGSLSYDGNWHHLAGVYDGATLSLWLDGTEVSSAEASTDLTGQTATLYFGGDIYDTSINGVLAEVRISNSAEYTGTFQPSCPLGSDGNTVAYWQFNEGSGTTAHDSSGSNTGTLQGSPPPTWVTGVTCGGSQQMSMGSQHGMSQLSGHGTSTVTNSPVNGSSVTITDTLGRIWGLMP